jgi:type II secretory pathway pseudopilin PulG
MLGVLLLVLAVACAQAQNASSAAHGTKPKAASKTAKTEERMLLEQLSDKVQQLEKANQNFEGLRKEVEELKKQLEEANHAAAAAQEAAQQAKQELTTSVAHNDEAVTKLQDAVGSLKATSVTFAENIQAGQVEVNALKAPETLRFKGIGITPGGFAAGETVWRQRGIGGDINTQFSGIPFAGQTAGLLSEFNASGRQSRVSLLADGKLPSAALRGYYESDFLSAGTTSNDNQSNSYTLRVRQAWAQARLNKGWEITAGQMWSLATENKTGLGNLQEAIPLTIDAQYNVGFTWARQYGFRVTKKVGQRLWIGSAVEESQTLNIGGHNLPTIAYQQAGNAGGLYNPTANYSFNYAPDVLAKIVYQPDFGHFEVFAIGRFFRDRVFPNGPAPAGATQPSTTSALGAFTDKTDGGGVGVNARVSLLSKKLDVGAHVLAGDGIGRYSSSTLPDATAHPSGALELLTGGSALGSVEWHPGKRLDLYAYYGGEYAKRAFYNTGYFIATPGPTQGQPILGGYGAPNNPVYGCHTEVLPVSSPNGGGSVPGSAANCQADNRNIQEGTFGYWYRFYQGTRGTLQQGLQYSYAERRTWQGIGNPLTGLGGSPKALDNMIFTSFRYYLPK